MFDKTQYPAEWPAMRTAVLARANNRCEGSPAYPGCRAANHEPHPVTGSRVVLTTAHKPGTSKRSRDLGDLLCLCQRCHNSLDAPERSRRAAQTRALKRGQIQIPGVG